MCRTFFFFFGASDPGKLGSSSGQMSSVQGSMAMPPLIRGRSSTFQRWFPCLTTAEVLLSSSLLLPTIQPGPPACPPNTGCSPGSSQDILFRFNQPQTLLSYNALHRPSPLPCLEVLTRNLNPHHSLLPHFCVPACSQGHCSAMQLSPMSPCLRTPLMCCERGWTRPPPPFPRYPQPQTGWTFTIRILAGDLTQLSGHAGAPEGRTPALLPSHSPSCFLCASICQTAQHKADGPVCVSVRVMATHTALMQRKDTTWKEKG